MRADRAFGADRRGTTEEEQRTGESIDDELAQERPDRPATEEAVGLEGEGIPDVEGQLLSEDSLEEDEFASPEEAALTIRNRLPGATDHDDPHPTDDD